MLSISANDRSEYEALRLIILRELMSKNLAPARKVQLEENLKRLDAYLG